MLPEISSSEAPPSSSSHLLSDAPKASRTYFQSPKKANRHMAPPDSEAASECVQAFSVATVIMTRVTRQKGCEADTLS